MNELRPKWDAWCQEFLNTKGVLPTGLAQVALNRMLIADKNNDPMPPELTETFAHRVFSSHAKRIGLQMSPHALMFVAMVISRDPGTSVMYAHVLRFFQLKKNLPSLNMVNVAEAFPDGFLTEDQLRKLWEKQKGGQGNGYDNLLDVITDAC